jgi:NTP pyrophosphatase (non-canonical NTP hydrolase)
LRHTNEKSCTGTGYKTEQYIGRAGKPETEKKALQIKLEYLMGLQEEITETIRQVKEELGELPTRK